MGKKNKRVREPVQWNDISFESHNYRVMRLARNDHEAGILSDAEYAKIVETFDKGLKVVYPSQARTAYFKVKNKRQLAKCPGAASMSACTRHEHIFDATNASFAASGGCAPAHAHLHEKVEELDFPPRASGSRTTSCRSRNRSPSSS